jgi:hypothetical protein
MTLREIFEQLPKLTPEEKRQLRNVLDRELASDGEQDESPEFLAELDRCVREAEAGSKTDTVEEARQMVQEIIGRRHQLQRDDNEPLMNPPPLRYGATGNRFTQIFVSARL